MGCATARLRTLMAGAAILAFGHTPRLPAAMLATWVPWDPGTRCDCGSSTVAGSVPFRFAARIAASRCRPVNSAP